MATVLLYHALRPANGVEPDTDATLFVDLDRFAWQLDTLRQRGYRSLTLDEFYASLARPRRGARELLLTFDDAYAHVLESASPLLRRCGFTAVAFVPVAHLGAGNSWDSDDDRLSALRIASPEDLREAIAGPWEIASHGSEHVDLTALEPAERRSQLRAAREQLSSLVGREVIDLAYPYGRHDASVRADARASGYRTGFTAGVGASHDPFQIGRRAIRGQEGEKAFVVKASGAFSSVFEDAHG